MAAIGDTVKVRLPGAKTWRRAGDVAGDAVRATGLNVIVRRLSAASESDGTAALTYFFEADIIRRQLGLSWADLITKAGAP